MFAVIYQAYLKQGRESSYKEAWKIVASYFLEHRGAIASSLHKTQDGMWVAYSKWPDQKTRDASWPVPQGECPKQVLNAIEVIQDSLDPQKKMPDLCMEVVEELY